MRRRRESLARSIGLALGLVAGVSAPAHAVEFGDLYRGTRAMAMGNAFVAVADDEQAIFYNPAGLAGIERSTFHYGVLDMTLSTETYDSIAAAMTAMSDMSGDTLNFIMGRNIYARGQFSQQLVMPNLGFATIIDRQVGLRASNKAMPQIELGYQLTNGFQLAYGVSLNRSRMKKFDLRVGVGAKMLYRRGGFKVLPMSEIFSIGTETISRNTGNFSRGFGFDLGTQYLLHLNTRTTFSAGMVYTDLGDTTFADANSSPIEGNLAAGLALTYKIARIRATVAYDQHRLLDDIDWRKKNHVGFELGLPIISLYAGLNQVKFTYGVAADVWLFRLTAATYTEEVGTYAYDNPEARWMLKLGLKLNL